MELSHEVGFINYINVDGRMWFCNIFSGIIVSLDLETDEVFYEVETEKNSISSKMQYGLAEMVGDEIYFIPRNATRIFVYNVKDKSSFYIELGKMNVPCGKPLFLGVCRKDKFLYLIPGRNTSIVRLDIETRKITHYFIEGVEKGELLSNGSVALVGDKLIVGKRDGKSFLVLDITEGKQFVYPVCRNCIKPLCALTVDNMVVFAGFGREILVYDVSDQTVSLMDSYYDCVEPREGIGQLLGNEKNIFAIAINQPIIYKISLENRVITKWIEFEWGNKEHSVFDRFTKCDVIGAKVVDDKIVLYSTVRNSIIEINIASKEIKYHDEFIWEKANRQAYANECLNNNLLVSEGTVTLKDYIGFLTK